MLKMRRWCFPDRARRVRGARPVSMALRALHLLAVALLLGGHAAGAAAAELLPWLALAVASGVGLMVPEVLAWGLYWFALGKGVSSLAKVALLLAIPFAWEARVPLLILALLWAAVTSHMPARLRHYSLVHGRSLSPDAPLARTAVAAASVSPGP